MSSLENPDNDNEDDLLAKEIMEDYSFGED